MLGNIHPVFRSRLQAMQLLAVAKSDDVRSYGCEVLLKIFIDQMKLLESIREMFQSVLLSTN